MEAIELVLLGVDISGFRPRYSAHGAGLISAGGEGGAGINRWGPNDESMGLRLDDIDLCLDIECRRD
jgi:hypothetical protein